MFYATLGVNPNRMRINTNIETARQGTLRTLADKWAARDIDGVLTCFAPYAEYHASVGPLPGTRAKGHREIAELISQILYHDSSVTTEVNNINIFGERAYWEWRYTDIIGSVSLGCDFFIFEGPLIVLKNAYRKVCINPSDHAVQQEPSG